MLDNRARMQTLIIYHTYCSSAAKWFPRTLLDVTLYVRVYFLSCFLFKCVRGQLKCDGTRAETRFRLSANGRVHLNWGGRGQFSRLLAAEVWASAVVMLDTTCSEVVWRELATHSLRLFPLHFPSRASCAITFQLKSTYQRHHQMLRLYGVGDWLMTEALVGWRRQRRTLENWEKPGPMSLCPPPIPHELVWEKPLPQRWSARDETSEPRQGRQMSKCIKKVYSQLQLQLFANLITHWSVCAESGHKHFCFMLILPVEVALLELTSRIYSVTVSIKHVSAVA